MKNFAFNQNVFSLRFIAIFIFVVLLGMAPTHAQTNRVFPEVKDLPEQQEMPDVMVMQNGERITKPAQWQKRRQEMKEMLEFYELGHSPPPPGNVSGEVLKESTLLNGTVKYRLVHLKFGPGQRLGYDVAIFQPKGSGPFPTIVNPSFLITPGKSPTNTVSMNVVGSNTVTHATGSSGPNQLADPAFAVMGFANQLARGYAIVTYQYTQCGADNADFRQSSFYPAYPDYDWGVLAGWAWGLSRCVDYLETQSFVDKRKIIALGHSRLGKLVMVATAFDERIALGAPVGSSGAGTGAYRFCGPGRGGAEGIDDMTRKFPYYFVPRLKEFTGHINKLPFDAHWFVALTAPRPWISVEGTQDTLGLPNAIRQTILAAKPVYTFLGVSEERVGVSYQNHKHALTLADWDAALDFADQQLLGKPITRHFDQFPPDSDKAAK